MKSGKILIIDDDQDVLSAARLFLKRHVLQVDVHTDPNQLPRLLDQESYDVILLDMNFTQDVNSGHEGFYWLDKILEQDPSAVVVLITAYGDIELAVKAIKEGATDFVVKPWENEKLLATLLSAMKLKASRKEVYDLKSRQKEINATQNLNFQEIIGNSPVMQEIFETIEMVAQTDANVLILGENGTGKELIARAIHRNSHRKNEVFINVDLGAISESLFESELFGHVKGAFTDAREDRAGRFEIASGGSLFLDELGNLSLPLQAKLLTALQNRKITRVGSNKQIDTDIRLICATNMPIFDMVKEKKFRQDLVYRINTITIEIPPLRDRFEDIPLLAEHFLGYYSRKYNKSIRSFSASLIKRMQKYQWPGNVRELQHAIERAVILNKSDTIDADNFLIQPRMHQPEVDGILLENMHLDEVERALIQKAMAKHNGNISHAAQELGITRSSLYRRLEKYGL